MASLCLRLVKSARLPGPEKRLPGLRLHPVRNQVPDRKNNPVPDPDPILDPNRGRFMKITDPDPTWVSNSRRFTKFTDLHRIWVPSSRHFKFKDPDPMWAPDIRRNNTKIST